MNFAVIDWQRPWLTHLRELGGMISSSSDWMSVANQVAGQRGLTSANAKLISFVPQKDIPDLSGYEAHIYSTGEIPTRDNLHDFFNALMWLQFPRIKQALNRMQYAEIERMLRTSPAVEERGKQRDAATLFDENCAFVISSDLSFLDALKARRWKEILMIDPPQFSNRCEVILFGHALIEKLITPYKAITAHVWNVTVESDWFELSTEERRSWLDQTVAEDLARGFLSSDFNHLPILGVPGWWDNQSDDFYDDATVFRSSRKH
jgi:hypothetical protein